MTRTQPVLGAIWAVALCSFAWSQNQVETMPGRIRVAPATAGHRSVEPRNDRADSPGAAVATESMKIADPGADPGSAAPGGSRREQSVRGAATVDPDGVAQTESPASRIRVDLPANGVRSNARPTETTTAAGRSELPAPVPPTLVPPSVPEPRLEQAVPGEVRAAPHGVPGDPTIVPHHGPPAPPFSELLGRPAPAATPPFSVRFGLGMDDVPPDDFRPIHWHLGSKAPSFLDQALPLHVFRVRLDAQYRMNHPDRAEFFWPKSSLLRNFFGQRDARGPVEAEQRVDNVDLRFYTEAMVSYHVSVFTDLPFRFVNPAINPNEYGFSDMSVGLKWAFWLDDVRAISLQVAGVFPTGDDFKGLGTGVYAIQPALLWQESLTDRLTLYTEVSSRMPIDPRSDYAGHVLKYGGGLSYFGEVGPVTLMPLAEIVGWTVLNGKQTFELGKIEPIISSVRGLTIWTTNYGLRFGLNQSSDRWGILAMSDLYVGYGFAISADWWFRDYWRIEYRLRF